jgi:hypothetical protein
MSSACAATWSGRSAHATASCSSRLEENIKRYELPWPDECRSVREYFELRKAEIPGFTQADLGEALGYTQQRMSQVLLVAQEMPNNPRVRDAPKFSTAWGITERA